ncbi:sulfate adenylyltransferase [Halomonas piscis]|uniref:Sulfate adenylyltransferase n=1 Tax=Halomonas piscis TaxID=3031727 RepID=A0ABY9YVD4_9GAMM|nr:sulfate adenylyltransferase [Halomonas piscis]WNK18781.1 sulfate adenylyltransferase [Halomonas piscis]
MNKKSSVSENVVLDEKTLAGFPQQPHGGKLVDRVAKGEEREKELERAKTLPQIMVDTEAAITLEMIATGVMSPNEGLMVEEDYLSTLETGRLKNGLVWPIPLSFAPTGKHNTEVVNSLSKGDDVVLIDVNQEPVAILNAEDIFSYDRDYRAQHVFGTTDRKHPGVDAIYRRMGDTALGGKITLLNRPDWGPFEPLRMEPKDAWQLFYVEKEFKTVAGFVTGANPMHRGHEYMHKNLLEEVDGLLVCPLVEMAKREFTRHEYRMLAYRGVLEQYYPKDRTILCPLRVTYVFAGPQEAILHALILKNFGCTHKIVGRDYAGVGDYYDKYASQSIFDQYAPEEIGIDIRTFHEAFFCVRCNTVATDQSCPHDESVRVGISGTSVREILRHGILPPKEIVRPESSHVAIQGVQPKGRDADGNTVLPVGKLIKSMFPFYLTHRGIGGPRRETPLNPDDLTNDDLNAAIADVRANGDLVYRQTYDTYTQSADINRSVQPAWVDETRAYMRKHQQMVVDNLEEKVAIAPEESSDEFMYQDREEAEKELAVARRVLEELSVPVDEEKTRERVWNIAPYDSYY